MMPSIQPLKFVENNKNRKQQKPEQQQQLQQQKERKARTANVTVCEKGSGDRWWWFHTVNVVDATELYALKWLKQ